MSTSLEALVTLEATAKPVLVRYLEALEAYSPGATAHHEILAHHDGSVIVAVPMPEDDDASLALGEYMAHIGTDLLLETDTSIILSQRPSSTF
jgi:hypothetical protein